MVGLVETMLKLYGKRRMLTADSQRLAGYEPRESSTDTRKNSKIQNGAVSAKHRGR